MPMFASLALIALIATQVSVLEARLTSGLEHEVSYESTKDTFCTTPVSKGAVKFPDSLAGRARVNFDMYSGYVNITSSDYLFYWFFGSQGSPSTDPLIVWTNGGPGCTAMEGATTEHGPLNLFMMKESCSNGGPASKCDYSQQLSSNPYAWNKHSNMLYVDQPKNVGYSFGTGQTKSSVEAGEEFVIFLNNWLDLFPEFKGRQVIIAGESYGGHYIPAWSNAIMDYNAKAGVTKIPFAGITIGNGCVNNTVQSTQTYVDYLHEQSLIPASSNPTSKVAANSAVDKQLGYTPNYYDYRLQQVTCSACYSYNYTAWSLWFLKPEVLTALNICGDAGKDAFAGSAGGCISMGAFDSRDNFDYSGALARALDGGIPVVFYYGKTDTACDYKGGMAMAETIPWTGMKSFSNAPLSAWTIADVEAGQIKQFGGLSFIQIENAGHMVPMDQPAASAMVIKTLLDQVKK
jgi:carboxypeptidase C (cathepsin A)